MLKWLLKSLLILAVFVPFATLLPSPLCVLPHAGRRSASASGWVVELLPSGS